MSKKRSTTVNLQGNQKAALTLLKKGVTVEQMQSKLKLNNTKAARGLVDRLREKGVKVKNVGPHEFKVRTRAPRAG